MVHIDCTSIIWSIRNFISSLEYGGQLAWQISLARVSIERKGRFFYARFTDLLIDHLHPKLNHLETNWSHETSKTKPLGRRKPRRPDLLQTKEMFLVGGVYCRTVPNKSQNAVKINRNAVGTERETILDWREGQPSI